MVLSLHIGVTNQNTEYCQYLILYNFIMVCITFILPQYVIVGKLNFCFEGKENSCYGNHLPYQPPWLPYFGKIGLNRTKSGNRSL